MVCQVHFRYDVIIHSDEKIYFILFFLPLLSFSSPSPPLFVYALQLPLYISSALCTFLRTLQTVSFGYKGTDWKWHLLNLRLNVSKPKGHAVVSNGKVDNIAVGLKKQFVLS
jgi:hypothetical protein